MKKPTTPIDTDKNGDQKHVETNQGESTFARYAGILRENKKLTAKHIVKHLCEKRGW
jgi:hypothetical protein